MNFAKAEKLLVKCVLAGLPALLTGAPGIGKTDLITGVAKQTGYDLIVSHPVVSEPVDAKGLPFPSDDKKSAVFLPYGDLARALSATRPTIWFLDDLGQASPAVQAAFMQLLLARRIGEHVLPDCVTFLAATNRKKDRAGVSGILEPVKSRFVTIIELEPELEGWMDWAFDNQMPVTLTAFLRFRPELLCAPAPTAEITNSPSPRTWANLGKLDALELDEDMQEEVFQGAVGPAAGQEYFLFKQVWRDMVSPDVVLLDPHSAAIPTGASTLYALTGALASLATPENFSRICTYAERLQAGGHAEIAAFMLKDTTRRHREIKETGSYAMAITGPLGELFK